MSKSAMTIPVFVPHMGCPHRCVFCNQWETSAVWTSPDAAFVRAKIRAHLATKASSVGHVEVAFFGGSFTAIDAGLQRSLLDAAYGFVREGLLSSIRVSTRPDCIDPNRLALLREYGVKTIEIGAQSFDDGVLAAADRGHTAEDSVRAAAIVRREGFSLVIQLMPGLPGGDRGEAVRSAETAVSCSPDAVRIYPTVVLEHTRLARLWREGLYEPLGFEEALECAADMHELFAEKNIPVIRTGLHPLSPDEEGGVLAGPYHPAFGFMVKARLKRRIMEREIEGAIEATGRAQGSLLLRIPHRGKEEYLGHRAGNMDYLRKRFPETRIERAFIDTGRLEIIIETKD